MIIYCAGAPEHHLPVISLNVKNFTAGDVGTILDVDYNIAVRTGLQCAPLVHQRIGTMEMKGTVRFSMGPFNRESDIDEALQALKKIVDMRP